VNRQLRLTSADMAGGRAEVGGQEQSIRTLAASASLDTRSGLRVTRTSRATPPKRSTPPTPRRPWIWRATTSSTDMAGGRAEVGGQEQSIRTLAASASLDTLAATSIERQQPVGLEGDADLAGDAP
jgi:hypothetical protein